MEYGQRSQTQSAPEKSGYRIQITGVVQGVGFRPFIYRLAQTFRLEGWVQNTSAGVFIETTAVPDQMAAFLNAIRSEQPPLARIQDIKVEETAAKVFTGFSIRPSEKMEAAFSLVPPDVAICEDCRRELFDPADHRYRYPFINCTNCGPRFSIIQDMPYDRPATTMAGFQVCSFCREEYEDPLNRRFHAQPIACPDCGPQMIFLQQGRAVAEKEAAIQLAREFIRSGKIIAIKGLGGFQLACDAANKDAVHELRRRKHRSGKAFALMAFDFPTVQKYCDVAEEEAALLTARQMPIVILPEKEPYSLSRFVSPGQKTLGVMLAYTPLHLLLCEPGEGFPELLVMTSANISEEPIVYQDDAIPRLEALADGILTHNRPIYHRMDDSVTRFNLRKPVILRRSRGYAPEPISLPGKMPSVLAGGALLKNTFTLTREDSAFVSPYIGDLENLETFQSYQAAMQHYSELFKVSPEVYACDLHPDFLSSQYMTELANRHQKPLIQVQHHHAHLAACLADNQWNESPEGRTAIGLIFDGTGLGTDEAIWGGEFLVGNYHDFTRAYHLEYVPLPGGDAAIKRPWEIALAYLHTLGFDWEEIISILGHRLPSEATQLKSILDHRIHLTDTSSMGRLFDAVSFLAGGPGVITYEGQAAIEFEAQADLSAHGSYSYQVEEDLIRVRPLFAEILKDIQSGISPGVISVRFHNTIAKVAVEICERIRNDLGIREVALSGGVWQNMVLLKKTTTALQDAGFVVLSHHQLPANDGCISYGQAVIAANGWKG